MAKNSQPEPNQYESSPDDVDAQSKENNYLDDSEFESEYETEEEFTIKRHDLRKPEPSSGQGSDSYSDKDTPPCRPEKSLKSIKYEQNQDQEKASKRSRTKHVPPTPPPTKPSAAANILVDGDADGDRAMGGNEGVPDATPMKVDEDSKKQMFQRLFSEEDEIIILEGLIEYKAKKGMVDPIADLNGFHEFINKDLHVNVSKSQISDKVRRFKKKLENNNARAKKNGKERKSSNPHRQKQFELSKKIWTVETNANDDAKPNKKAKIDVAIVASDPAQSNEVAKMEVAASDAMVSLSPLPASSYGGRKSVEEMIFEDGLEIVDGAKKLELQEKWKQLKADEIKIYLKRLRLIQEQTEAVLHALQGPNSSINE